MNYETNNHRASILFCFCFCSHFFLHIFLLNLCTYYIVFHVDSTLHTLARTQTENATWLNKEYKIEERKNKLDFSLPLFIHLFYLFRSPFAIVFNHHFNSSINWMFGIQGAHEHIALRVFNGFYTISFCFVLFYSIIILNNLNRKF